MVAEDEEDLAKLVHVRREEVQVAGVVGRRQEADVAGEEEVRGAGRDAEGFVGVGWGLRGFEVEVREDLEGGCWRGCADWGVGGGGGC